MSSWLFFLLAAAPAAVVADRLGAPPWLVFLLAALGVVPLAGLIGLATEELSVHVGPKFGGLLNATFGNAAELIITIFAVRQGLLELVKASITGSIIGNSLLILGLSFLMGGLKHGRQTFDSRESGRHGVLMLLALAGLYLPALSGVATLAETRLVFLSELVAGLMLLTYFAYIGYSLIWGDRPGRSSAVAEAEVGAHHEAKWSLRRSLLVLAGATLGTVIVSELLVRTVEPVTHQLGWSEFFVGVIIVPLIGNAAEHASAVTMALKNRVDLTMAIAAGSSTQVALFVAPLLVFLSLLLGHPMDLVFTRAELLILGITGAIFAYLSMDGESNWLEGLQLLAVYAITAVVMFFVPSGPAGH